MSNEDGARSYKGMIAAAAGLAAMVATGALSATVGGTAWQVAFLLCQTIVISLVIWQVCDPFAEAAQWIGTRLHIPGSVRGATLDAIASSMPELFSGIFFVVVAVFAVGESSEAITDIGINGFGPTVATCAGSAIYNMILIPAICALVISYTRKNRPTIDIAPKVILRDGLWFLACELLLIVFLFQPELSWWMGVVFLVIYVVYIGFLYFDATRFRRAVRTVRDALGSESVNASAEQVSEILQQQGITPSRSLVTEIHTRFFAGNDEDENGDEAPKEAAILFGLFLVRLNMVSAWAIIFTSTILAAASCYWLVLVTRTTAEQLGVPLFFVAVILAAAASSVPDTFLSVGAAKRGDDDGAISNAFGSNIFDICVCLAIPLLVCTGLNGWQPITLTENGEPMAGLVGIRILLCVLTLVTLLIMWHNQQLTRRKAIVLCLLYALFVCYAVAGSLKFRWADMVCSERASLAFFSC